MGMKRYDDKLKFLFYHKLSAVYKCSTSVVIAYGDCLVLLSVLNHRYLIELFVVVQYEYAVLSSLQQAMLMSSHMFDFYPKFVSLVRLQHLSVPARIDQLHFGWDANQFNQTVTVNTATL